MSQFEVFLGFAIQTQMKHSVRSTRRQEMVQLSIRFVIFLDVLHCVTRLCTLQELVDVSVVVVDLLPHVVSCLGIEEVLVGKHRSTLAFVAVDHCAVRSDPQPRCVFSGSDLPILAHDVDDLVKQDVVGLLDLFILNLLLAFVLRDGRVFLRLPPSGLSRRLDELQGGVELTHVGHCLVLLVLDVSLRWDFLHLLQIVVIY